MMKRNGFTTIEAVIGLAILVAIAYLLSQGFSSMQKISSTTQVMSATERQINDIADNIRTGLESYQINFNSDPAVREVVLKVDTLPMAWDNEGVYSVTKCQHCPGRYGYIIQPVESYRGLYIVTLRMTHKIWPEKYKDYQFLVSVR